MVQAPTLSVVLPNYNHAHLLPRAIAALLAQERPPDEIIVVDDGSTDDSRTVIAQMAARAPAIRVMMNDKNLGVVRTQNRALEAATGRYIYLAAADDWVLPGHFKLAIEALEANPSCGLFCGESMLVDGKSDRLIAIRPPARPTHQPRCVSAAETVGLLKRIDNWILTNTCVFRRDCMIEAGGLDARLGPFADGIMARKIALTRGFFFAPAVVASWAVFSDGYSRRAALNLDQAKHFLEFIPARLSQDPAFPKWYPSVFAARWRFATSRLALETEPIDNHHVASMGARSSLDRIALKVIWTLLGSRPARLATLAWLSMRLRPTSLFELAHTALARRMERRNGPRAVEGL